MNFFNTGSTLNYCDDVLTNELEYEIIDDEQQKDQILEFRNNFTNSVTELIEYIIIYNQYNITVVNFIYDTTSNILNLYCNFSKNDMIAKEHLITFMKLIVHIRSVNGYRKTFASYVMLDALSNFFESGSKLVFKMFVTEVGCWKDIKRFYDYYGEYRDNACESNLIHYGIELANEQLKLDMNAMEEGKYEQISYASKWIPREKGKYNSLYCSLAYHYFRNYFNDNNNGINEDKACNKAKMNYRKILTSLNKQLDTVQIKQCNKNWSKINPEMQTSKNLKIYKKAFLNKLPHDYMPLQRNTEKYETSDRIICSYNFEEFYSSRIRKRCNSICKLECGGLTSDQFNKDACKIYLMENGYKDNYLAIDEFVNNEL